MLFFQKKYLEMGGDGFYGAWSVPYLEPVMSERNYVTLNKDIYKDVYYEKGLCPVAEKIQKNLMIFKTNYRSIDAAEINAKILKKVIKYFIN